MYRRAWSLTTFVGCLLWVAAGLGMLVMLAPTTAAPNVDQLVALVGCTALAILFSRARMEFVHGSQRLFTSPDAGFLVLVAVVAEPSWAAFVGALALLNSIRHAGTLLERAFLTSTGALATGMASIVAHETFTGAFPEGREVIVAVLAAAAVRAVLLLNGQLLLAESRARGGALAVLRDMPATTILMLEAGLPVATVAMAGPFLDAPSVAMLVVFGGQLLTWRVLRIQHQQFRASLVTGELLATFNRYVPQHVARDILARDGARGEVTLGGGEQRDISVMFIDIRGFTAWSERTAPGEVLLELNRLLGELADAILATGGTLDKFTGDGLMAFWNAPADQPDHALRAVQTLPRLLMRVREFNLRREVQRSVPLEIGIGVATGPATVGNIGHRDRLAYTAIGDTVNLAARLEKATKDHDIPALVDERTFLALPTELQRQLMRLDSIEVKGRSERVRLYAPVALAQHRTRNGAA